MSTKKPVRPLLSPALALRALLRNVEAYLQAATHHHDASYFCDQEAMDQANAEGEAAYSNLVISMADAREALE